MAFEDVTFILESGPGAVDDGFRKEAIYLKPSRLEPFAKQKGFGSMADLVSHPKQTSSEPMHNRVV